MLARVSIAAAVVAISNCSATVGAVGKPPFLEYEYDELSAALQVRVEAERHEQWYDTYPNTNTYEGHGSSNIDSDETAPSGLTEADCKQRCSADAACSCVTREQESGRCWKRGGCTPADFDSQHGQGFDVYLKVQSTTTTTTIGSHAFDWIRRIAAGNGGKFVLEAKMYYIDQQYQLPANTEIYGSGSGGQGTIVKAVGAAYSNICWENAKNRKGFLLGDNTYVSKLHFVGMDTMRFCDNQLLCGGAPFETPGCAGTGTFEDAPETCGGDTGIGRGVENATVNDVTIEPMTVQSIFYAAPTKLGVSVSKDITIRNVVCNGTWADGLNIHGAHQNVLVEDCEVRNTGDDTFAIWSIGAPGANNITFSRNIGQNPWYREGCSSKAQGYTNSNYCFAVYGGEVTEFLNSTCTGAKYVVVFGNDQHKTYGGTFTENSTALVQGVQGMAGDPCYFGVEYPGTVLNCTAAGF